MKKSSLKNKKPVSDLQFDDITPVAPHALGGLVRDHFANGRLYATVAAHGGLINIGYWGKQHLGAPNFFNASSETGWTKLFRVYANIGDKRYYLMLNDTKLYPFGISSHCELEGVEFEFQLLLLPDALVQRFRILRNPKNLSVRIEMLHQESCTATSAENRTWGNFAFQAQHNALIAFCRDENPTIYRGGGALAQKGLKINLKDAPKATTWIGLGCDTPFDARCGYHARSKHYLTSEPIKEKSAAFFVAFGSSQPGLKERLDQLATCVHAECDRLIAGYEQRLLSRPRIDTGNPVLNSAFSQYPEIINQMRLPDCPGATRASCTDYYVWGWDGMTPLIPSALANEPEYTAATLRFFQETLNADYGIPIQFTTDFRLRLSEPFPAQCQYIAGLYHYVATTGDLVLAEEVFPTCKFILDRCRKDLVKDTGLVSGNALWPDFPEAMEENGDDVSSLNNSLLYQGLRAMEYISQALGDATLAKECQEWAQRLRTSFVKYLYDEEKGYFISSCSSKTLIPRKHYCCQAIFWITPFARELVAHAPDRISKFMDEHLRSSKCLLSLPQWDTAWMADGNQLGSSYPTSDYFYVNVHKLLGDGHGLETWLGDVEWFWRRHTTPEAFTPEGENEEELGPDNTGGKQCQSATAWYACLYMGLAGMDFDHEGLTLTPWGSMPIKIRGLTLHGKSFDLEISGKGRYMGALKVNGKLLAPGSRKLSWTELKGDTVLLELVRSKRAPKSPEIVRADGLRVTVLKSKKDRLAARIGGNMTGDVVVQTNGKERVFVDDKPVQYPVDPATGTITIPFLNQGEMMIVLK